MDQLISPEELYMQLQSESPPVVIDVRQDEAYAQGHIPGAIHIRREDLERSLHLIPKGKPVVTY